MRAPSFLTVLTGLNLALLVWLALAARDAIAGQAGAPVLRATRSSWSTMADWSGPS